MSTNGNGQRESDELELQELTQRLEDRYRDEPDRVFKLVAHAAAVSEHTANRMLALEELHRVPCVTLRALEKKVAEQGREIDQLRRDLTGDGR